MITRSRAKMASNSDSVEFEVNNQLDMPNNEEDNTPSDPDSVVETPDDRARGPTPRPQEVSLETLMTLISENNRIINEKIDKQNENHRIISEKLDQNKEEVKQQVPEQIAQMLSIIHICKLFQITTLTYLEP